MHLVLDCRVAKVPICSPSKFVGRIIFFVKSSNLAFVRLFIFAESRCCSFYSYEWLQLRLGMPESCCAIGCTNRYEAGNRVSFYRIPSEAKYPELRQAWLKAIRRKNWEPKKLEWICSEHFIGGKRSHDELSPAYVPQVFCHTRSPRERKLQ